MQNALISNFDSLPPLLSTQNLVDLGLYSSIDAAYAARLKGHSPDFIKLHRKILYTKASVIEFIERRTHKGDNAACSIETSQISNEVK